MTRIFRRASIAGAALAAIVSIPAMQALSVAAGAGQVTAVAAIDRQATPSIMGWQATPNTLGWS